MHTADTTRSNSSAHMHSHSSTTKCSTQTVTAASWNSTNACKVDSLALWNQSKIASQAFSPTPPPLCFWLQDSRVKPHVAPLSVAWVWNFTATHIHLDGNLHIFTNISYLQIMQSFIVRILLSLNKILEIPAKKNRLSLESRKSQLIPKCPTIPLLNQERTV